MFNSSKRSKIDGDILWNPPGNWYSVALAHLPWCRFQCPSWSKLRPQLSQRYFFQVSWDVRHIAEMGVVQVEHNFVLICFLAQIPGNDSSVLTKDVNVDIDVECLFEVRYFRSIHGMIPSCRELLPPLSQATKTVPCLLGIQMIGQTSHPTKFVFVRSLVMFLFIQPHNTSVVGDIVWQYAWSHRDT